MRQSASPFCLRRRLLLQQRGHDRHHIDVAAEMIGFHERAVRLLGDVAQMHEVDAVARTGGRWRAGRWCARAERAGAEGQAVRVGRDRSRMNAMSSSLETILGRPNSGRGGSSGWMHRRTPTSAAVGITSRRNRARFSRSASRVDALVAVEHAAQRGDVVAVERAGQAGHDGRQQRRTFRSRSAASNQARARREDVGRVVGLGAGALRA